MAGYKLSAAIINRKKTPGKMTDGLALSFMRNKDGSLTAWQRAKRDGKEKDIKVATLAGEVTAGWLQEVRAQAFALKSPDETSGVMTFEKAWNDYYQAVTTAANSKWAPRTADQAKARMLNHIAASGMWMMPVPAIRSADIEEALSDVRVSTPKLAPKVLQLIGQVISYAAHDLQLESNPAMVLQKKLKASEKPVKFSKLPAITEWTGLGALLHKIETSTLYPSTRWALLLQAYTAQRSGEVARARWKDIDLAAGVWTIPRAQMKVSDWSVKPYDQRLQLSAQAIDLLRQIPKDRDYLFTPRHGESSHLSVEAFSQSFQRLGFRGIAVPHGWRSSIKTLAIDAIGVDERPLFAERWVDDVLDHTVKGVEAHYTRAQAERGMARVLYWWGEQLDMAVNRHRS